MRTPVKTLFLVAVAAVAALSIAACGGSKSSGWTASDTSQLKSRLTSELTSAASKLSKAKQAEYATDLNAFATCTASVIEPAATPNQVLDSSWKPSTSLENKVASKCETPFENQIKALSKS